MRRTTAFAGVVVVIVAATVAYLVHAVGRSPHDQALPGAAVAPGPVQGTLFVRDTRDGPGFGHVGVLSNGRRTDTGRRCDRIDVDADLTMACLAAVPGVTLRAKLSVVSEDGSVTGSWRMAGIPSRTRLSPSGTYWAATTFVTGHSYTSARFSTSTLIGKTEGGKPINLEDFALSLDGKLAKPVDRNYWGVTFADDDRTFYATVATGNRTWLVRGDLADRTVTSVHAEAECPSLSPDGSRVAYKKRGVRPGATWTLAVLDLASGDETLLDGERASVDDQVMWLDDQTLLYGLPHKGKPGTSDVWALDARAGSKPRLYVEGASSPAVARR
jgi:hypothetical protein